MACGGRSAASACPLSLDDSPRGEPHLAARRDHGGLCRVAVQPGRAAPIPYGSPSFSPSLLRRCPSRAWCGRVPRPGAGVSPSVATAVAGAYPSFARLEARGRSAAYESLAESVADDPAVVGLIASLPLDKRQPNLLFAAARYLLGEPPGIQQLRDLIRTSRAELTHVILTRCTQTNEPARCAVLLPALAQLPEPLALIEAGASAGLTLLTRRATPRAPTSARSHGACPTELRNQPPLLGRRIQPPIRSSRLPGRRARHRRDPGRVGRSRRRLRPHRHGAGHQRGRRQYTIRNSGGTSATAPIWNRPANRQLGSAPPGAAMVSVCGRSGLAS